MAKKKPTIRDVAKASGLAVVTVSRVLNNHKSVSPDTARRVRDAVRDLGYTRDAVAQSMRTGSTRAIGFMITDISNPVLAIVAKNAEEVLREAGYFLVLANTGDRSEREIELIRLFRERRVDALIMNVGRFNDEALHRAMQEIDVPVVLLDRDIPVPLDVVKNDHATGMRKATEYLLDLGHRRIGLITAGEEISPGRERVEGFYTAHEGAGIAPESSLVRSKNLSAEFGFKECYAMLTSDSPPTALIAGGNQILIGALRAIALCNRRIPEELSLISCDHTPVAELSTPPITVITRDLAELGRAAARTLLNRLTSDNPGGLRRIILPTEFVLRQSCAPPPSGGAPSVKKT